MKLGAASKRLTEKTLVGIGWTSLAMGGQAALQLVALILLARLLQPKEFGIYAASMVLANFCSLFCDLGVAPAIVQRPDLSERHIRVGYTLTVVLSVAISAIMALSASGIASFFHMIELETVVRIMACTMLIQGVSIVAMALAQRELRFRWLAAVDATAFLFGFVVVAPVLAYWGWGIWGLVAAYVVQQCLRSVLLLRGQRHVKIPLVELRALRELLFFGAGHTMARIGNSVAGQGDNLVVGSALGPIALGLYGHAYQLMAAPAMLFGRVLDRVLFPVMAVVQSDRRRLARAYRSSVSVCALVMLPSGIIVFILAEEIIAVLLGRSWLAAAVPLRILACGMLFRTSYKISDTIARATGAVYARAWRQALFALLVIVGSAIGQFWGLAGVAIGVLCALAINFVLMSHLSLCLVDLTWVGFLRAHIPGLALCALVGILTWPLALWLRAAEVQAALILLSSFSLAGAVSIALFWHQASFFLGDDHEQLTKVVAKLISKGAGAGSVDSGLS